MMMIMMIDGWIDRERERERDRQMLLLAQNSVPGIRNSVMV